LVKGQQGTLLCSSGIITELVDWGVIPDGEDKMHCARKSNNLCLPVLNDKVVKNRFISGCLGKKECTITKFDDILDATPKHYKIYSQCNRRSSSVFFQYMCK